LYRLLESGEKINENDEFLDDDCKTWITIGNSRWAIGAEAGEIVKPIRRQITGKAYHPENHAIIVLNVGVNKLDKKMIYFGYDSSLESNYTRNYFFDLNNLQVNMIEYHGWNAQQTLNIALKLHNKGLITQPRTDSGKLPFDFDEIKENITKSIVNSQYVGLSLKIKNLLSERLKLNVKTDTNLKNKVLFMDLTVEHQQYCHGILPTGNPINIGCLDQEERVLYRDILSRFCSIYLLEA
jgi:DNA topoisomerase IA